MDMKELTTSQRAKVRKLQKAQDETIKPMWWARSARENEVRAEAWKALECSSRIAELEAEYAPRLQELEELRKAIAQEYQELTDKVRELRLDIQTEPYQAVYNDEHYKALGAIIAKTKEHHDTQMAQLLESFKEA